MPIDINAAERFVHADARLLDRHGLAALLHGAPVAPVLDALRAYRNPDGGFGHALEPDVRAPESEPAAVLHALEVLAGIDALDDPMVTDAAAWIAAIAALRGRIDADGSIPVPGGTENERLTPLALSERPGSRSRALFTDGQIEADLRPAGGGTARRRGVDLRLARVVARTGRGMARSLDAACAGHARRTRAHRGRPG